MTFLSRIKSSRVLTIVSMSFIQEVLFYCIVYLSCPLVEASQSWGISGNTGNLRKNMISLSMRCLETRFCLFTHSPLVELDRKGLSRKWEGSIFESQRLDYVVNQIVITFLVIEKTQTIKMDFRWTNANFKLLDHCSILKGERHWILCLYISNWCVSVCNLTIKKGNKPVRIR